LRIFSHRFPCQDRVAKERIVDRSRQLSNNVHDLNQKNLCEDKIDRIAMTESGSEQRELEESEPETGNLESDAEG
jgi:hypothetical protein